MGGSQLAGSQRAGIRVERPGALTTLQDAGRPGLAHLGVPRSGALDPAAHRLANRLVGNPAAAPVLETTLTGVALRFTGPATVAVTGAAAPVTLDGCAAGWGKPVAVGPGQLLDVGRATAGVRCYVAVSGGFTGPATLGSVSTDLLSGLGAPRLTPGQLLATGAVGEAGMSGSPSSGGSADSTGSPAPARSPGAAGPLGSGGSADPVGSPNSGGSPDLAGSGGLADSGGWLSSSGPGGSGCDRDLTPGPVPGRHVELPIHFGPRDGWLSSAGRATLAQATFTVAIASNRIGLRLEGDPVAQLSEGELPSEGLVWGAIQLLPDGGLVVFLADHPTTGGYPVVAVVDPAGFSACAQAAPGSTIRFRPLGSG